MTFEIKLPESVHFYYANNANQNAMDELIQLNDSNKTSKLRGLSLEDLNTSNLARLAAIKTQVDYWEFLIEIWNKTWGVSLVTSWQEPEEIDESEYDEVRDFKYVWANAFYKEFSVSDGYLVLGVGISDKSVLLYFYFMDENEEYLTTDNMKLSENWKPKPEDNERWTKDLLAIAGKQSVDVRLLQDEANKIVMQLQNELS